MSVALISAGVILYLIGCWVFSKRSKRVMTMMVVAPLDAYGTVCDAAYDMPYYLFAAVCWFLRLVRARGLEFVEFALLCVVCIAIEGLCWSWNACKGMAIGAFAGARGRRVYSVNHGDITVNDGDITVNDGDGDGGDDDGDDSPKPNGAALRHPLRLIAS